MTDDLPHLPRPALLNTWKHHAGWIRWRIGEAVLGGASGVAGLTREMAVVGARLMDLYVGNFTPAEIGSSIVDQLKSAALLEFDPLAVWLQPQGEFALLELPDGSKWTLRLGPRDGRYLHLHPGRWSPRTIRVQANTLRSAVMAHAHSRLIGAKATDLTVVNEARQRYLGLLPMHELRLDSGLGAVIAVLG
jgi:hypothetical protein